jgi:hypothetical protein
MNLLQIPDIQARLERWNQKRINWLIKHNTTFANVHDHASVAVAFRKDPERVAEYYKRKGGKDV